MRYECSFTAAYFSLDGSSHSRREIHLRKLSHPCVPPCVHPSLHRRNRCTLPNPAQLVVACNKYFEWRIIYFSGGRGAQKHPVAPPPEQMCFGWKWVKPRGSGAIPILLRCKANPSNGLKIISVGVIMAITINVVRDGPPWWYLFTAYSQRATPCCIIQINKVCLDVRQGGRWSVLKQNVCTWVLQINLSVCLHQSAKTLKPFAANPK